MSQTETDENVEVSEEEPKEKTPKTPKAKPAKGTKKRRNRATSFTSRGDNPTTLDMVIEALVELNDKKGTSVQSIKGFIQSHYVVNERMLTSLLRKAIAKGMEKNLIARPADQANAKSNLNGRFMVHKEQPKTEEPPKPRPTNLRQLGKSKPKAKKKKKRRAHY